MTALKQIIAKLEDIAEWCEQAADRAEKANDLTAVLTFFHDFKTDYRALDAIRKRIYAALDRLDKSVIPAAFERVEQDKVRIPSLGRSFYPLQKHSATMPDRNKGMEWLRDNGGEDLIQPTVNASALASFIKEKILDEGVEPDPEIIKFTTYYITGSSKYTPKEKI